VRVCECVCMCICVCVRVRVCMCMRESEEERDTQRQRQCMHTFVVHVLFVHVLCVHMFFMRLCLRLYFSTFSVPMHVCVFTCMACKTFLCVHTARSSLDVGREVTGLVLDAPQQKLMISRRHAQFSYIPKHLHKDGKTAEGQWMVTDLQSTNGMLFNGCKVMEAKLTNNDVITFGGAKSTQNGFTPSDKAMKSIYCYKYIVHDSISPDTLETPGTAGKSCGGKENETKHGQKRGRLDAEDEEEEAREQKRQQAEQEEAEERSRREQQERERQEMERQEREEAIKKEKERQEFLVKDGMRRKEAERDKERQRESAALEKKHRLEHERLAKAQLDFEKQKQRWAEQQRLDKEAKATEEKETRKRQEKEAREKKAKEALKRKESERREKEEERAKAKKAAAIVVENDHGKAHVEARPKYWQEDARSNWLNKQVCVCVCRLVFDVRRCVMYEEANINWFCKQICVRVCVVVLQICILSVYLLAR